jgi:hypothetical protein
LKINNYKLKIYAKWKWASDLIEWFWVLVFILLIAESAAPGLFERWTGTR